MGLDEAKQFNPNYTVITSHTVIYIIAHTVPFNAVPYTAPRQTRMTLKGEILLQKAVPEF